MGKRKPGYRQVSGFLLGWMLRVMLAKTTWRQGCPFPNGRFKVYVAGRWALDYVLSGVTAKNYLNYRDINGGNAGVLAYSRTFVYCKGSKGGG